MIADNVTGRWPGVRADPVRAARHGPGERGPDLLSGLGAAVPRPCRSVPARAPWWRSRRSLGAPRGAPFAVVISPLAGSGPAYACRAISASGTGGALQSLLPVASSLVMVPLPTVRNEAISAVP